jgi:glyoxylase-like metal-dependent hydrolase (beta-lactamase superfamily II)
MTWRVLLSAAVCCVGVGRPVSAAAQAVEVDTLADGVYLLRTPFDGYVFGSSVAVVNERDVLVFDTNTRPSTARTVLAAIRRITPKPVRWVVNSHWHPDHWSGNEVYSAAFPGVQIVATAATREFMRRVAPAWPAVFAGGLQRRRDALAAAVRAGKLADGTPLSAERRQREETELARFGEFAAEMATVSRTLPTVVFDDSLTLFSGAREFRLVSLSGDAEASTVVYLPRVRVLLAGDLLVHPVQWDPNSYRIRPWIASLRSLAALEPRVVVPGHGPAFRDTGYLMLVIGLLESIVAQVDAGLERGLVTSDDVRQAVRLDEFRPRFAHGDPELAADFDATTATLIDKAYLEARDGLRSRR